VNPTNIKRLFVLLAITSEAPVREDVQTFIAATPPAR